MMFEMRRFDDWYGMMYFNQKLKLKSQLMKFFESYLL